jgi:hypothetical protein
LDPGRILSLKAKLCGSSRSGIDEQEVESLRNYVDFLEQNPKFVPDELWAKETEKALAVAALETALKRHAGSWAAKGNPVLGLPAGQPFGRDLRSIKWVIGVGGIFIHGKNGLKLLQAAFSKPGYSLFPENPKFRLDDQYILYALGLLGRFCPELALSLGKGYFEMESI